MTTTWLPRGTSKSTDRCGREQPGVGNSGSQLTCQRRWARTCSSFRRRSGYSRAQGWRRPPRRAGAVRSHSPQPQARPHARCCRRSRCRAVRTLSPSDCPNSGRTLQFKGPGLSYGAGSRMGHFAPFCCTSLWGSMSTYATQAGLLSTSSYIDAKA